jgi:TonB family C-terminal domain
MKKLFLATTIVLVSIFSVQAQEKIKIAVMDFTVGYGVEKEMVSGISDVLSKLLSETDKFTIVEQEQLHLIASPSSGQAIEIDEIFDKKITGVLDYSNFHDKYSLDIRVTAAKKNGGIIYITKAIKDESDVINKALRDLMSNLAEELTNRLVEDSNEYVYDNVDEMLSFPGGMSALNRYISMNLRYPAVAVEHGIQGRVICRFIVKKDGSIFNVEVLRSLEPSLDKEAVRVIEEMPKWIPGLRNGVPVNVYFVLPISFKIQ